MPKPVELEACSQDIIIEPANHLDIPRISELNRQLNLELPGFEDDRYDQESWISEEIGNENFFVLKEGAFVVGAISIIPSENELFIQTVAVDKDVHGKGLGKKLIDFAKEKAIEKKVGRLSLYTLAIYGVKDFYLRCGFEPDDPPTEVYKGQVFYRFIMNV